MQILAMFEAEGRKLDVAADSHVFRQGDRDSNVYLVRSGLLKACYSTAEGKEHIKSFVPEGSIIGSMAAIIDHGECSFSLVALEPTQMLSMPFARLQRAALGDLELANALIDFLCAYGKRKERREYEFLSLSPMQRYLLFLETMPEVADRISQADLAEYIGITPQALSRIKRRL